MEREAREECGFIVKVRTSVGKAVQIIYSAEEREYFEKICEFVEVEMVGAAAQSEPDHQVDWLSLDQALGALTHESHRWAVDRLRKRHL